MCNLTQYLSHYVCELVDSQLEHLLCDIMIIYPQTLGKVKYAHICTTDLLLVPRL